MITRSEPESISSTVTCKASSAFLKSREILIIVLIYFSFFSILDRIQRIGFSKSSAVRRRVRPLQNKNDDGDDDQEEKKSALSEWKEDVSKKLVSIIPASILEFLSNIWKKIVTLIPGLRIAFFSFLAGGILAMTAIFVPVYSSIDSLSEPVTLFETILADLDRGYVDPVDTNKLFETGVAAMLRSLDPYTEFEAREEAQQLNEGIMGKYGGVGLVISGAIPKNVAKATPPPVTTNEAGSKLLPKDAIDDNAKLQDGDMSSNSVTSENDDDEDDVEVIAQKKQFRQLQKAKEKGVRVVAAFEGYAFDYGMRVGDKLLAVDGTILTPDSTVEDVRNILRGEPGTTVTINFEREGVDGVQVVSMPRQIVQVRDVKLATLIGKPQDGIGYVSLSGFASNAGPEVRQAIFALERAAEDATNGDQGLQGLILDLRGNPGGLLTSAVDVASLLVPKGSDIVSAKGRGFPGVIYRSRVDPILNPNTKLAVLINKGTASAAEIVSGAVQDLDVGVIVGSDRTFGKGLVQNVEDLPFNTALKFTVAKYYTPSGRCIQGVNYKEGGGRKAEDVKFSSSKVAERDRQTFYTRLGRIVKDGGGVEADFKVEAPKASALEITLLRSDALGEFASQWSRKNQLTNNFEVDDFTYREFQAFIERKEKSGDIKLEDLYAGALTDLKRALKESGYKSSEKELEKLQADIVREVKNDFEKYKTDIREDIANAILSRYLPESMLLERGLKNDQQVDAAVKLLSNKKGFEKVLAKGSLDERSGATSSISVANADGEDKNNGAFLKVDF
jgi:carboxyl-terminal processing protease